MSTPSIEQNIFCIIFMNMFLSYWCIERFPYPKANFEIYAIMVKSLIHVKVKKNSPKLEKTQIQRNKIVNTPLSNIKLSGSIIWEYYT